MFGARCLVGDLTVLVFDLDWRVYFCESFLFDKLCCLFG